MSFDHKHTPRTPRTPRTQAPQDILDTPQPIKPKDYAKPSEETLQRYHEILADLSKRSNELDDWVREHIPNVPVDRLAHALQITLHAGAKLEPSDAETEMYTKLHTPVHAMANILVDTQDATPCTLYLTALHHMRIALSLALSDIELPAPLDIAKVVDEFPTYADVKHATATYPHGENTKDDADPA